MSNEYTFDDDDDDDELGGVVNKPKGGKANNSIFAPPTQDLGKAITDALGSDKVQLYKNTPRSELNPDLRLPRLRPKNKLPDPIDAFDWARPDDVKRPKKGKKPVDITGLSRKQQKKAVGIPGMAPLFDFLNVYRHGKKGKWR